MKASIPKGISFCPDFLSLYHLVKRNQSRGARVVGAEPDCTPGEKLLTDFQECVDKQKFNFQHDENGDIRQYECPECGGTTALIEPACDECGCDLMKHGKAIRAQSPDIEIPRYIAVEMALAYEAYLLEGVDLEKALKLKLGDGKRPGLKSRPFLNKLLATAKVRKLMDKGLSFTAAAETVTVPSDNPKSSRTIMSWCKDVDPTIGEE